MKQVGTQIQTRTQLLQLHNIAEGKSIIVIMFLQHFYTYFFGAHHFVFVRYNNNDNIQNILILPVCTFILRVGLHKLFMYVYMININFPWLFYDIPTDEDH